MSPSACWSSPYAATARGPDPVRRLLARWFTREAPPASARLGRKGEALACRHLRKRRYRVLARNVRTARGEADIVALAPDRRTIVVVEVKARTRSANLPSTGERAISAEKKRRLIAVAQEIARRRRWQDRPLRIDVVAIDQAVGQRPVIRHHERAVTLNDR